MRKLSALSTMLILFLLFSNLQETSAQIQDIKKKSSSNKSKRTSSSSSKSSSKKKKSKSYSSSSSSSSSNSDVDASDVFGCISSLFDVAGCLISAFENNSSSSSSDYTSNDYDYEYDYYEPEEYVENNEITESGNEEIASDENTTTPTEIEVVDNVHDVVVKNEIEIADDIVKSKTKEVPFLIDTTAKESEVTLDIRANFDLSMHKGIDKNYIHVDYLPGLRAKFDFFIIDFRFNVLTEYTDDFPDSFKSWELLAMFNVTPNQNHSILFGTGIHREEYGEGATFHEYYLGVKLPLQNKKDYIDIDTRFSADYKTKEFPFFEFGGRYNVRFLETKNLSGYITMGATYQNYYQSYDIWGIRGGVILNIH